MTDQRLWVIDTNVLISRLLAPRDIAAQAVDRALEGGILLASDATLEEVAAVLSRPEFDPYVPANERQRFIALLGGITRVVPITHKLKACRDPRDDTFLDVALAGGARAIITGDADLLALDPFHGVPIVTPARFLDRYREMG